MDAVVAPLTLDAFVGVSVQVTFAGSNLNATWDSSRGTLLELAEALGLTPKNGCRSGMCGVCAVRIVLGEVEYLRPTLADPEPGTALICKAVPKRPVCKLNAEVRSRLVLDV